jgi:hypothetical protein
VYGMLDCVAQVCDRILPAFAGPYNKKFKNKLILNIF